MRPVRRVWGLTGIGVLVAVGLVAGCGAAPARRSPPSSPPVPRGGAATSGSFALAAAQSFTDPGFHQPVVVRARVPRRLPGGRLAIVLTLRDASRPRQTCSEDHPLSGCATVDWSDDPSRPHVPPGGVFDNAISLRLAAGARTLHLRRSGAISPTPDAFTPG